MSDTGRRDYDIAVVGGGLVGTAIAWGLAKLGQRVAVLDEGDNAFRASRGNFALVWVQSKGLGMPAYAAWTVRSAKSWIDFADGLRRQTGIDVGHNRPGGFHLALSEAELAARENVLRRLHNQPDMQSYRWEMLGREQVRAMLPQIGPEVVGGSYCPLDGHVNSLKLLRALHTGMQGMGTAYFPNSAVERIEHAGGEFRVFGGGREVRAAKLVLAAGNGSAKLGPMVGLDIPVRPQRGQVVVTERTRPFLNYPVVTVRQTDEGSVMLGNSVEEAGFDPTVGTGVTATIANRAVRMFPLLGRLNVVRTWAALRVMTPDGFAIYDQSETCPGAFAASCHSGVTLAANHVLALPPHIVAGKLPEEFAVFSARRFDVPAAA